MHAQGAIAFDAAIYLESSQLIDDWLSKFRQSDRQGAIDILDEVRALTVFHRQELGGFRVGDRAA